MYTGYVSVHNHVTPKTADLLAQLGGWNQGSRTIFERALHLSLPTATVEFHRRTILVAQILIGHTPRNQCFIAIHKKQRETLKKSPGTFAIPTISRTSLINWRDILVLLVDPDLTDQKGEQLLYEMPFLSTDLTCNNLPMSASWSSDSQRSNQFLHVFISSSPRTWQTPLVWAPHPVGELPLLRLWQVPLQLPACVKAHAGEVSTAARCDVVDPV